MAERDYYLILGVPRDASQGGIRSAFRDLAKRHHPDQAGPESAERFRDIREAYEVLSHPGRRRAYDALRRPRPRAEPLAGRRRRAAPEPLAPDPVSLFGASESPRPSAEELLERWMLDFTGRRVPKAKRIAPLDCDLRLSPAEAARGGVLPLEVPVARRCPDCDGAGRVGPFPCGRCDRTGLAEGRARVRVRIPPGLPSGAVLEVPLGGVGVGHFALRVRIRVDGSPFGP